MHLDAPYSNELVISRLANAGHIERAENAILDAGGMMYGTVHGYERLGRLLGHFPPDAIKNNLLILCLNCIYLCKQGQARRARVLLEEAKAPARNHYLWQYTDLWVASYLDERAPPDRLRKWMMLETKLPIEDDLFHGIFFNHMLIIVVRLGQLKEAELWAQRALEVFRRLRRPHLQFYLHIHLCDMNIVQGNITTAHRHLASAHRFFENAGIAMGVERELLALCELAIEYETGKLTDLAAKATNLRHIFVDGEDGWVEVFLQCCRIGIFATYFTKGYRPALSYIEECQIDYHQRHGQYSDVLEIFHATLLYLEGRLGDARDISERIDFDKVQSPIGRYAADTIKVRLGFKGSLAQERKKDPRALIHEHLLKASQLREQKRIAPARRAVESAMRVAASHGGLTTIFLEYRNEVEPYSSTLSTGSFARGHVQLARLARYVHRSILSSYSMTRPSALSLLSRQQFRVLSQLQTGATNKEIARSLGLSENTVKYHLKSLFKEFEVVKRGQLIELINL